MAKRQGGRGGTSGEGRKTFPRLTLISGIAGGVLLGVCLLVVGGLLLIPRISMLGGSVWVVPWAASTPAAALPIPQLTPQAITLPQTNQQPTVSRHQALFLR